MGRSVVLWAEYIPTEDLAEYMLYPRLLALAEVAWTNPQNKSWESFKRRVNLSIPILQQKGYNTFTLSKDLTFLWKTILSIKRYPLL